MGKVGVQAKKNSPRPKARGAGEGESLLCDHCQVVHVVD